MDFIFKPNVIIILFIFHFITAIYKFIRIKLYLNNNIKIFPGGEFKSRKWAAYIFGITIIASIALTSYFIFSGTEPDSIIISILSLFGLTVYLSSFSIPSTKIPVATTPEAPIYYNDKGFIVDKFYMFLQFMPLPMYSFKWEKIKSINTVDINSIIYKEVVVDCNNKVKRFKINQKNEDAFLQIMAEHLNVSPLIKNETVNKT